MHPAHYEAIKYIADVESMCFPVRIFILNDSVCVHHMYNVCMNAKALCVSIVGLLLLLLLLIFVVVALFCTANDIRSITNFDTTAAVVAI